MIITIDTHKDDADSIRKAIGLLQALAGDSPVMTNASFSPSGPSEGSAAAFAGIFGDDSPVMPAMPASPAMPTQSASAAQSLLSSSDLAAAVPPKEPEIEFY